VGFWTTIPFTILWISMFAVGKNSWISLISERKVII
jgi:hypothetical protein